MWRLWLGFTLHFARPLDCPVPEIKSRCQNRINGLVSDGLLFGYVVHPPEMPHRDDGDHAGDADQSKATAALEKMSPPVTVVFSEARRASGDMIDNVFNIQR